MSPTCLSNDTSCCVMITTARTKCMILYQAIVYFFYSVYEIDVNFLFYKEIILA